MHGRCSTALSRGICAVLTLTTTLAISCRDLVGHSLAGGPNAPSWPHSDLHSKQRAQGLRPFDSAWASFTQTSSETR
jgi:hypothetical protein